MRGQNEISNSDDIIDSRDILDRIEYLRDEIEAAEVPDNEIGGPNDTVADERHELASLEALAEEASGSPDWTYGEALIRDSYFEEYAEQLADDIGAIDRNATWPLNCIDWKEAADQLKMDYFSVEFDGVTYWIRS